MKKFLIFIGLTFVTYTIQVQASQSIEMMQTYQNNTLIVDCSAKDSCTITGQAKDNAPFTKEIPFTNNLFVRWLDDGNALITINDQKINYILITFSRKRFDNFVVPLLRGFNNDETIFLESDHNQNFACSMLNQNCVHIAALDNDQNTNGNASIYFFNKQNQLIVTDQGSDFCFAYSFNNDWFNNNTSAPNIREGQAKTLDPMQAPCFNPYNKQ